MRIEALFIAGGMALCSPIVAADEVTFTQTIPLQPSPWIVPIDLPPFDDQLGALQETRVSLDVHMEGTTDTEYILSFPTFMTACGGGFATFAPVTAAFAPAPYLDSISLDDLQCATVDGFDGVLDYLGPSAASFSFSGDGFMEFDTEYGLTVENLLTGGQLLLHTLDQNGQASGDGVVWNLVVHLSSAEINVTYDYLPPTPTWVNLGDGLAGGLGEPTLVGAGSLIAGTPVSLTMEGALPLALTTIFGGVGQLNAPFKGGVLVPNPQFILGGLLTDGSGGLVLASNWPPGLVSGIPFVFQIWINDATGPKNLTASNAVQGTTP